MVFPFSSSLFVHPALSLVNKKMLTFSQKRKAKLIPWQVNEEQEIRRVLDLGAQGVISDFPERLKRVYNKWCEEQLKS